MIISRLKAPDTASVPTAERSAEFHPNRQRFEGCLTLLDTPSDKAPSGARGHRVVLTREAAEAALPGLLGMAVGFLSGWDGHNARQRCGIIDGYSIVGKRLLVKGYIFCADFPDVVQRDGEQPAKPLGMSYELKDADILDQRASIWKITRCFFVGAAVLSQDKAAYSGTSFKLLLPATSKGKKAPEGIALGGDLPADAAKP